jgi:hypothetical protein
MTRSSVQRRMVRGRKQARLSLSQEANDMQQIITAKLKLMATPEQFVA